MQVAVHIKKISSAVSSRDIVSVRTSLSVSVEVSFPNESGYLFDRVVIEQPHEG
jgi:hypothetical protein